MAEVRDPLVGREGEVESILAALRTERGAIVVGEAGVGKSHLVEVALRRYRPQVQVVVATETSREIPLGAFAHVVDGVAAGSASDLLARACRAVEDLVGDGVLFIDDAHQLDPLSLTVVTQVVTRVGTRVVATVRTPPDPPAELVAMWNRGTLRRVQVDPLDREGTILLTQQIWGRRVETRLLDQLWRLSQGNVLFLRELMLAAVDAGARSAAAPRLGAVDGRTMRLRELVWARIGRLEEEARATLEAIAVAEPVPVAIAERALPIELLERLEQRRLIRHDSAAAVLRSAHPLYGEVVRARLPVIRRRRLLRDLLDAVDAGGAARIDPVLLARWRLDAGTGSDPSVLVDGAWTAFRRFDNPLCERLARRAHEEGDVEGSFVLVEALMGQGRPDEADAVLDGIAPTSDHQRVRVAIARAANRFWQRGDVAGAIGGLDELEERLDHAPHERARCEAHRSVYLLMLGDLARARSLAEGVLEELDAPDDARVRAAMTAGFFRAAAGRGDDVLAAIDEWTDLARRVEPPVPMADALLCMSRQLALLWTGRAIEAERYAADDLGLAADDPPAEMAALFAGMRGRAAYLRGRVTRSIDLLRQSIEIGRGADWLGLLPWGLAYLARAEAYLGRVSDAQRHIEQGEAALASGTNALGAGFARADLALSRAWCAAAEGARSEAVAIAFDVADAGDPLTVPVRLDALHAIVRIGGRPEVVDQIRELVPTVQGPLAPLVLRHAEVAADGEAGGYVPLAEAFAELGLDLIAHEALTTAAHLYRTSGSLGSAITCEERAAAIQARNDVPPPPISEPLAASVGLTEREQEVALLAAHGHSAPEIAERLYISARTVHTHLQRSYRKLGVNNREGLADRFGLS